MTCTTHHHACDCREHKIAVLLKAAMDAAVELDWTKNNPAIDADTRDRNQQTVERVQAACDALSDPAAPFCGFCGLPRPCLCVFEEEGPHEPAQAEAQ